LEITPLFLFQKKKKMKQTNLLLLGVLFIAILAMSFVTAEQNVLTNYTGNESTGLTAVLTTTQVTINPIIGGNVTYCTTVNLTILDNSVTTFNLTQFYFHLPDNATSTTATDFYISNTSNVWQNATEFINSDYNYVNFSGLDVLFNNSQNGTQFNITWKLLAPIAQTKLAVTQAGRQYTETWNITSAASNMTIENASLTMVPSYWYTRVGNPISVQFNTTNINYGANLSDIVVYTSLNHTEGTGNLLEYGSGWGELSIIYNGPTVDSSSGSSSSTTLSVRDSIAEGLNAKALFIYILIGIGLIGVTTLVVILLKRI